MKGVILTAGEGTRLRPTTKIISKNLLPAYDRPMIHYALRTMKHSGITEVLIVCSERHLADYQTLLDTSDELGMQISYTIQHELKGTAHALREAKEFAGQDNIAMMFCDGIYSDDFAEAVSKFKTGAFMALKKVDDPHRFGIAQIEGEHITQLIEKPENPPSDLATTGFYLFDSQIFKYIYQIQPSDRGELELTDAINMYIENKQLTFTVIDGYWKDVGTYDALLEASNYIKNHPDQFQN